MIFFALPILKAHKKTTGVKGTTQFYCKPRTPKVPNTNFCFLATDAIRIQHILSSAWATCYKSAKQSGKQD